MEVLREHQRLMTSGARAVLPFRLGDELYLAVPQLAEDLSDTPAHMNGGTSDVDLILFRWDSGQFVEDERLPVPGGEDAELFEIDGTPYLATASVRTGSGPYDLNLDSMIFRRTDGKWVPSQGYPTFAAKQWHHFQIGDRRFLALAQGVTVPTAVARNPRTSRILEWNGRSFEDFQVLDDGGWGYNWESFTLDGHTFLAYADHTSPSRLLRWDGERFAPFQSFAEHGGRVFRFFERNDAVWLLFAAIDGDTNLYRWDGTQFVERQLLGGAGGRELHLVESGGELHLVRICFIEGSPQAPKTDLISQIFRWAGDTFETIETFPTFGGTDSHSFHADGIHYLAVSESLTADVRFRQDSVIYQLSL